MVLLIKSLSDIPTTMEDKTSQLREFSELKHKFAVQNFVETFVNEVPVMQINEVAGSIYSLIRKLTQSEEVTALQVVNQGLQILINITCISPNTSIYLGDKSHFFETMLALMNRFPNDAVWLLGHICYDGSVNLSQIVSVQLFSRMAKYLNEGS